MLNENEDVKVEGEEPKETPEKGVSVPHEEALAADAASKEAGENTEGVLSPDPIVGESVPSELVMPGQVVDPRTGKVLDGGGVGLATPRPNPLKTGEPTRPEKGEEWAGNHTI